MSLATFGAGVGVSKSTVLFWEEGKKVPCYRSRVRIADFTAEVRGKRKRVIIPIPSWDVQDPIEHAVAPYDKLS